MPDATGNVPALADVVTAYRKTVAAAQAEQNRQTAILLKNYLAGLDGLIKTLTQADKMEAAMATKVERDRAASELADLEPKAPKTPKTTAKTESGKTERGRTQDTPDSPIEIPTGSFQTYAWDHAWTAPNPKSGVVVFKAKALNDIHIGLADRQGTFSTRLC